MYIIGTAGHVDHGKTELIKALTDINTSHIPEEKERGMTIDLGFAHFQNAQGEFIGVVDVPGHEKFIRNMVSGIWALDLVLLVVAADDQVMEMTKTHALICKHLGIRNIILVLNKIDLMEDEKILDIQQNIKRDLADIIDWDVPIVKVSSLYKTGIEELKKTVIEQLSKNLNDKYLTQYLNTGESIYFIDRVFDVKGSGQIATGSLCGKNLQQMEEVFLFPSEEKAVIKSLQAYHQKADEAQYKTRVAINFRSKQLLKKGHLVVSHKERVLKGQEFLLFLPNEHVALRNRMELEIAIGTKSCLGKIYKEGDDPFVVIHTNEVLNALKNQPCILISHGGSEVLAQGIFIDDGMSSVKRKSGLEALRELSNSSATITADSYDVFFRGFIEKEKTPLEIESQGFVLQNYFILNKWYQNLLKKIKDLLEQEKGLSLKIIGAKLGLNIEFTEILLYYLIDKSILSEFNGVFYNKAETQEELIGKKEQAFLKVLDSKDILGISSADIKTYSLSQQDLKNLIKLKKVTLLEIGIYISFSVYKKYQNLILKDFNIGDEISIATAKEKTGLSRKYGIPILNQMESYGFVKRVENNRVILRK